jgi:hypothetical protein
VGLETLLRADPVRVSALQALSALGLPDAWLAAGFVRNAVWDARHGYPSTPLNDVDVIFFDSMDADGDRARRAERALAERLPELRWQVRNQARMHSRNDDRPYRDCADAMSFWPEIETAVGARLDGDGEIELLAPFGTGSLLAGRLTANPKRARATFFDRVRSKRWLEIWPRLELADAWAAEALNASNSGS